MTLLVIDPGSPEAAAARRLFNTTLGHISFVRQSPYSQYYWAFLFRRGGECLILSGTAADLLDAWANPPWPQPSESPDPENLTAKIAAALGL